MILLPKCVEDYAQRMLIPTALKRCWPDKGGGAVRPIGVCEVLRRIIGQCVTRVDACGSLQVCAGLKSGSEASIHAKRSIFDADKTDAVLLIDASNVFNALNRAAALGNV